MKKAFLLLIAAMVMTGSVWFRVSAADTASIKTTVYSELFTNIASGKQVPARMMVDESFQNLNCAATERPGYISCQIPNQYAGQQITFELTKNKIMYIYIVDLPNK
jgi:hypothetical protein